jgi:hypothetical protein
MSSPENIITDAYVAAYVRVVARQRAQPDMQAGAGAAGAREIPRETLLAFRGERGREAFKPEQINLVSNCIKKNENETFRDCNFPKHRFSGSSKTTLYFVYVKFL